MSKRHVLHEVTQGKQISYAKTSLLRCYKTPNSIFLHFQRKFNFVQRVQELFFLKLSNCCTFQFGVFPVDSGCNPEYVKCAFGVPRATPCDLGNKNVHLGSKVFTTPILVK